MELARVQQNQTGFIRDHSNDTLVGVPADYRSVARTIPTAHVVGPEAIPQTGGGPRPV